MRRDFSTILEKVVQNGWLGDKSGQGFYKKSKTAVGKDERLVLDLNTLEYRPVTKPNLPSLEMAKNAASLGERLRLLLAADPRKDKAAAFLWPLLSTLWNFSAGLIGEAANDAPSIDRAMRAGFNWEMGPFEMWDAAGVRETEARMHELGIQVTGSVDDLLDSEPESVPAFWYAPDGPQCYNPKTSAWEPVPQQPGHATVADFRRTHKVVRGNSGASLVDIGDGIACIELHSLKNAIGGDVVSLVSSVLKPESDAVRDFIGFVISGDRDNFSRWRQPDAASAGRAGGRVGRGQRRHSGVPADDAGHQILSAAGGRRAVRHDPRRRHGDVPSRRAPPASRGNLHGPG